MILVTAAIEHDPGDPFRLGLRRDQAAQREALRGLALALDGDALAAVGRAEQREALGVVPQLGIDVLGRAEHHEPGPLGRAGDFLAHAQTARLTRRLSAY